MVLVDGKQRLKAVRSAMAGSIPVFGRRLAEYDDFKSFTLRNTLTMHIASLPTECEIIEWYLDLNDGGTVHTEQELEKVREMLK